MPKESTGEQYAKIAHDAHSATDHANRAYNDHASGKGTRIHVWRTQRDAARAHQRAAEATSNLYAREQHGIAAREHDRIADAHAVELDLDEADAEYEERTLAAIADRRF